jgi:hypothetical protein
MRSAVRIGDGLLLWKARRATPAWRGSATTKHGTDCMSGQKGQTRSERLAAQILFHESFVDFDPSHPLGGKDGGKDAIATKEGMRFAMAVYFPRGQQTLNAIRVKFEGDHAAFVTS